MKHHTGYLVWQFGQCHWHRSLKRAYRRANEHWASSHAQIIDCKTGRLVYGVPQ